MSQFRPTCPRYILQWNVSYQRQIAKDWLATATYIGNRTNHILGANEQNMPQNPASPPNATSSPTSKPPPPADPFLNPTQGAYYSSIVQSDDGNVARYNGLLLKLDHRFSHHVTWLTNYTWSQCISTYDFGGELAGNNYQNPNNRNAEKARLQF